MRKPELTLTLHRAAFAVMVTGEKHIEIREAKKWIKSRLENRTYKTVRFVNGYGHDKPYFVAEYLGYYIFEGDNATKYTYSNEFKAYAFKGDYVIQLGAITERGNLKS